MRGQRPNAANQLVRESLTDALFLLMENQLFEKISIADLVAKAGVGRASFYRNYISKEEIIGDYLIEHSIQYWDSHITETDAKSTWSLVFEILSAIGDRLVLIEKAGLSWLFYPTILELSRLGLPRPTKLSLEETYATAAFAGLLTGTLTQWLKNGREETPEQLAEMMLALNFK